MYNIISLDLYLTETGLKTYFRLKTQLDQPKHTNTMQSHLDYWESLQFSAEALWFKQYTAVSYTHLTLPTTPYV